MRNVSVILLLLLAVYPTACAAPTPGSQSSSSISATATPALAPDLASATASTEPPATATAAPPTDTPVPLPTDTAPAPLSPTAPTPASATPSSAPTSTAPPAPTAAPSPISGAATEPTAERSDAELIARGIEVYRENYCGTCHTLDAADTHGIFGPPHNGVGTTAAQRIAQPDYTGSATTAEGYIRESLIDPNVYHVPGYGGGRYSMPSFSGLDKADLDALVYMLLNQK